LSSISLLPFPQSFESTPPATHFAQEAKLRPTPIPARRPPCRSCVYSTIKYFACTLTIKVVTLERERERERERSGLCRRQKTRVCLFFR
jgi:hypothetical protein